MTYLAQWLKFIWLYKSLKEELTQKAFAIKSHLKCILRVKCAFQK